MKQPTSTNKRTKTPLVGKSMHYRVLALRVARRACKIASEFHRQLLHKGASDEDLDWASSNMEDKLGNLLQCKKEKRQLDQETINNYITQTGVKDMQEGLFLLHALYYLKKTFCLDIDINQLDPVPIKAGGVCQFLAPDQVSLPFNYEKIPFSNVKRGLDLLKHCEAIEWEHIPSPPPDNNKQA